MTLSPAHQSDLERAVAFLEQPRLAIRLANLAGKPLDGALNAIPALNGTIQNLLQKAIMQCLTIAVDSQEDEVLEPSAWLPKTLTGLTGGLGGLFGAAALPIELPLTTTLMLRAILDIARHQGEDLKSLEPRLACIQVFGLGNRKSDAGAMIGYFAARRSLSKLTSELTAGLVERTVLDASAPVVTRMVSEIVSRFGFVWSERFAAGALPVLGALGGATLNMIFMDHFERMAHGHFIIRRLERTYGREVIAERYKIVASGGAQPPVQLASGA
jgi:hypothetical protein